VGITSKQGFQAFLARFIFPGLLIENNSPLISLDRNLVKLAKCEGIQVIEVET
jgi:hypothetical protein